MRSRLLAAALLVAILWSCLCYASDSTTANAAGQTVIEGVLTQVSKLPKAESNPYLDCYYTAVIEIKNILSGRSVPKKAVLVLPGFFARQYAPEAHFKTGDMIRATVVPFASMPDKVKQTQQADEVEDVDLEFYYPQSIATIKSLDDAKVSVPFTDEKTGSEKLIGKQKEATAATSRSQQIRHDLHYINEELAKHGGDWDRWYDSLRGFREEYKKKYDAKAARWIGDSYFSAGLNEYGKGYSPDFVSSLVAFNKYLAERNVDLIVVRVPQKGEIVDDLFVPMPKDLVSNPYLLRLYKELLEADVEVVVDVVPRLKQSRMGFPLMYYYQDFAEEHPAEGAAWALAEVLVERIQRYESVRKASRADLKLGRASLPQHGLKWPEGNPKFNPAEPVSFSSVTSEKIAPLLRQGTTSPILVVGSSFIGSPSFDRGGNIPAYLAYLSGVIPDVLYREGSNATIPRAIAREGDGFLKNRSACIFPLVPWSIHLPLDLPPIVNPAGKEKVLITSYTGNDLRAHVTFSQNTPKNVFTFSPAGDLTVQSQNKETRMAGDFELDLPEATSRYPYILVAVETKSKDAATIKALYGKQSDTVHKSYTQDDRKDFFVFKVESPNIRSATFSISNIRSDIPMIIETISIYGLK
ncbi:alginate O-acetyltransferase AlgX-related protein [Geomonas azotofigens]|uniref:alginate O-acetyltransferase AlgX-related protein n=1 Tax=Geomonas azotofigens TaxID=2843196 RepID=UPI001C1294C9|nr:hypothetical protein [Geomonas azotofigens]MBU5614589.1 hypothetical protein [Geomonas azotofigens]